MRVRCQASWRGFINIPLHLEVPEALALTVAQADQRPANAGRREPWVKEEELTRSRGEKEKRRG